MGRLLSMILNRFGFIFGAFSALAGSFGDRVTVTGIVQSTSSAEANSELKSVNPLTGAVHSKATIVKNKAVVKPITKNSGLLFSRLARGDLLELALITF
jgi:hypothetical protein